MKLKSELRIAGRRVAQDTPPYIIGEMACGHQGSVQSAKALVDAAVSANADCVQLQIFDPAANMVPNAPIFGLLKSLFIDAEGWREIVTYTRQFNIHISIFVYDEPSLELALRLGPDMLKVNSSELSNPAMLIGVARSGLPFTMGTGASTLEEIRRAVQVVLDHGGDKAILTHGVQSFPTTLEEANISKIKILKKEFGGLVVYADHTSADDELSGWIDLAAIGQGAELLEKHLILSRIDRGVDWQAALEPHEFKKYVDSMRKAWSAMGHSDFQPLSSSEQKYRLFQKKSVVAGQDIALDEIVTLDKVRFMRAQGDREGIAPIDFEVKAAGRRLNRKVSRFEQIFPEDLGE